MANILLNETNTKTEQEQVALQALPNIDATPLRTAVNIVPTTSPFSSVYFCGLLRQ
jgi:hypothetical protein